MSNTASRRLGRKGAAIALALAVPLTAGGAAAGLTFAIGSMASAAIESVERFPGAIEPPNVSWQGSANPGDVITVTLDGVPNVVTADNRAEWYFDARDLTPGPHTAEVKFSNGTAHSYSFTVDAEAPVLTPTVEPANPNTSTSARFVITASEDISYWNLTVNDVYKVSPTGSVAEFDLAPLAPGTYTVKLTATDFARHQSAPYTYTFDHQPNDTTEPVVEFVDAPTQTGVQASFVVRADKPIASYRWELDGQQRYPGSPQDPAITFYDLSPGQHTLTVTAVDLAGNEGTASVSFETLPPDAEDKTVEGLRQASGPASGSKLPVNSAPAFEFTADEPISAWRFWLNEAQWYSEREVFATEPAKIALSALSAGEYTLRARAFDMNNNADDLRVTFTVVEAGMPTDDPTTPPPTGDPTPPTDGPTTPPTDGPSTPPTDGPTTPPTDNPTPGDGPSIAPPPGPQNPGEAPGPSSESVGTYAPGDTVTITAAGFTPFEDIEVWVHSTPRFIKTVEADDIGAVTVPVELPKDLELGAHKIVLRGVNSGVEIETPITVAASDGVAGGATPKGTKPGTLPISGGDAAVVGVTTALLVAAGMGLLFLARRRQAVAA